MATPFDMAMERIRQLGSIVKAQPLELTYEESCLIEAKMWDLCDTLKRLRKAKSKDGSPQCPRTKSPGPGW